MEPYNAQSLVTLESLRRFQQLNLPLVSDMQVKFVGYSLADPNTAQVLFIEKFDRSNPFWMEFHVTWLYPADDTRLEFTLFSDEHSLDGIHLYKGTGYNNSDPISETFMVVIVPIFDKENGSPANDYHEKVGNYVKNFRDSFHPIICYYGLGKDEPEDLFNFEYAQYYLRHGDASSPLLYPLYSSDTIRLRNPEYSSLQWSKM